MTTQEIIELGTRLGLPFKKHTNFPDQLSKNIVVFDGCCGQRFLIDGSLSDDIVYEKIGRALIMYGKRLKNLEIHDVMSITGDFTSTNDDE